MRDPIYAVSIVLHPGHKWQSMNMNWTLPRQKKWLRTAKIDVEKFWNKHWKTGPTSNSNGEIPSPTITTRLHRDLSSFEQFARPHNYYASAATSRADEYQAYIDIKPTEWVEDMIGWWAYKGKEYPHLQKMAFDILSIPAMSAEVERVFSSAKDLLTDSRNKMMDEVIEAVERLKHWYKAGAITLQVPPYWP
jgi:hypothetical protein